MMFSNSDWRDKTYDRETLDETFATLAEAFRVLIYPTCMLIPATVDELVAALRSDYENHGLYDISTFACGVCLANGITYKPWSDEALQWLADNRDEVSLQQFVGPNGSQVNLCRHCAERISWHLWIHTDTTRVVPPPFDLYADPPHPPGPRSSEVELETKMDD